MIRWHDVAVLSFSAVVLTAQAPASNNKREVATVPIFSQTLAFTLPAGWKLGFHTPRDAWAGV